MHSAILDYRADGLNMRSHLFRPDARKLPGIVVFPEAFGLGEHALTKAERLAKLGYVVLASDLHGEGKIHSDLQTAVGLITPMMKDPTSTRSRARAALDALIASGNVDTVRMAAIGYCFGGTMALELARSGAAIAGAVGFHSGLATARPQDAANIKGKVLVCIGADDPAIDAAQRQAFETEMRAGKVDWQMQLFGGVVHSFTNPAADKVGMPQMARYDAQADQRSWNEMCGFFEEIFAR